MESLLLPAIVFLVPTFVYWYVQLNTGFFSQHYFIQIGGLLLSGLAAIWFAAGIFSQPAFSDLGRILMGGFILLLGVLTLLIAFIKLVFRQGDRAASLHALSRSQARFGSPAKRVQLTTKDDVKIVALHLSAEPEREKAVIVCHGGGRSKDIEANVLTCELLFEEYDVITFDFRGHQESGGKWTGDDTSKYDLECVIDFARGQGYRKIGVVGWSFGAWIAVIEVAEYHNADALVAAAPPPFDMRDTKITRALLPWTSKPWSFLALALVTVFRNMRIARYNDHPSLMDYVGRVSPIPLLIVCNDYDTTIGMEAARFRELFDRAGPPKQFHQLGGAGHIYNWPNTFHYLTLVRAWLADNLA